jgi:hypothetical protein
MQQSGPGLLLFDRDGWVLAFSHIEKGADWMESIDVLDGEYEGAFTLDGFVVDMAGVREGPVSLRVTGERDDIGLRELLLRGQMRMGFTSDVDDPVSVANELMREQWERLLPGRPKWLHRRLHGDHPPQV